LEHCNCLPDVLQADTRATERQHDESLGEADERDRRVVAGSVEGRDDRPPDYRLPALERRLVAARPVTEARRRHAEEPRRLSDRVEGSIEASVGLAAHRLRVRHEILASASGEL